MNNQLIQTINWFAACEVADVPGNGGVCVKFGDKQIALFHFSRRNEWYATQNECPHKQQMALSRGMIGTEGGEPKIACPFHKRSFSLRDGRCMNTDDNYQIKTYPVKVENNRVYIGIEMKEESAVLHK